MAEKKKAPVERKIIDASEGKEVAKAEKAAETAVVSADNKKRATSRRVFAVISWVVAIVFEVLTILTLNGTFYFGDDMLVYLIVGVVIDLAFVILGSLLWKKANRIDPASKSDKVKFFLQSQLGVIAAILAFLPLVIILLRNKDLDAKTKKIASIVAAVALVLAVGISIDYNPPSSEDLAQAQTESTVLGDGTAYWTRYGKSYHFDPNCQTLLNSEVIYSGTVEEAFEANRSDPCDFCAGGK